MKNHLKLILQAAILSPSGDNCQPFRYKIENDETIVIRHIEQRAKHFLNHENFASILSLGTVIESISIQARALGYSTKVTINDSLGSAFEQDWATVQLSPASELQANLVSALSKRFTCRGPFKPQNLSESIFKECEKEAQSTSTQVKLFWGKPKDPEFINYLKESDMYLWKHKEAATDFLKLVRFTQSQSNSFSDGLSLAELEVKFHESISLWLMKSFPAVIPIFYYLGLKQMAQKVTERNYLNSGGLIAFSVDEKINSRTALYEVGLSFMRTWLYLSSLGYVVQPITTASLLCYQASQEKLPPTSLKQFNNLFIQGKRLWIKNFHIPQNSDVVWAMRVGLPLETTKKSSSRRLNIQDVIDFS